MTFGRTSASTWSFEDDGHMSSIHFEVENLGSHGEVRDRGSTNGTWLNNNKISREQLREGDRIRAGKTILTVEFVQSPNGGNALDHDRLPPLPLGSPPTPPPSRPTPHIPNTDSPLVGNSPEPSSPTLAHAPPYPRLQPLTGDVGEHNAQPEPYGAGNFDAGNQNDREASPARPINPFDSIDFSEPAPASSPQPAPVSFHQQFVSSSNSDQRVGNPISESSFSFRIPSQPSPDTREAMASSAAMHLLLERQTTIESAEAFAIIMGTLSQRWSIQLVVHFQKIRSTPPPDCVVQPLFQWLTPTDALNYAPVRINWSDVQSNATLLALLPRLCRADACLAFLGKSSIETSAQVEQMLRLGVEGFSEADGFLPVCWPSSFSTILDVSSPSVAEKLFARRISGAILCSPWNRNKLVAVVDAEIAGDLRENSFIDTARISS